MSHYAQSVVFIWEIRDNGIENAFKRIAKLVDGELPGSQSWHADLLLAMTRPTPKRTAVIGDDLPRHLKNYLDFRHFFRSAYTCHLSWESMSALVLGMAETLNQFEGELDTFLENRPPSRSNAAGAVG